MAVGRVALDVLGVHPITLRAERRDLTLYDILVNPKSRRPMSFHLNWELQIFRRGSNRLLNL